MQPPPNFHVFDQEPTEPPKPPEPAAGDHTAPRGEPASTEGLIDLNDTRREPERPVRIPRFAPAVPMPARVDLD